MITINTCHDYHTLTIAPVPDIRRLTYTIDIIGLFGHHHTETLIFISSLPIVFLDKLRIRNQSFSVRIDTCTISTDYHAHVMDEYVLTAGSGRMPRYALTLTDPD